MKSFGDYLGLSNSCSYDVDDVIGRVDRFGFQNFCSPGGNTYIFFGLRNMSNSRLSSTKLLMFPSTPSFMYSCYK